MNIFARKFFTKLLAVAVLVVGIFSMPVFVEYASAANYPTPTNGATIFVSEGNFLINPAKIARKNVIDGASEAVRADGGTPAQAAEAARQAEIALNNGTLNIKTDPNLGLTDAKLQFEGKTVANGADQITQKLKDFAAKAAEDATKNAQPPKAQEDYCVFMQGGNVQDSFNPGALPAGVATTGSATGYGNYDPIDPTKSSIENQRLTETRQGTFEDRWLATVNAALANMTKNPGQGVKIYLPNAGQSVDGALLGEYNVDGVIVKTGTHYTIGKTAADGITVDENCKPTKGEVEDPGNQTPPGGAAPGFGDLGNGGGGGGNGGGGNGGGGGLGDLFGGGGGGGLGALLPLLMQGLLGGQQGQQQQGQGQNPYGAGYGNQQKCDAQTVAPVCGIDGKTYNNACYAQQMGVIVRSTGICVATSPSPTPGIDNALILTRLAQSGIPVALLENVLNLVSSVLSGILAGANISETVVQ